MAFTTIMLAIVAALLAAYYLFFRSMTYFKDKGIPYERPLPIVGNTGSNFLSRIPVQDLIQRFYTSTEPTAKYFGVYWMSTPIIMIRDLELIKSIAVKNFESFPNHQHFIDNTQDPLFNNNLVALRGQRWREVRTAVSPSFTTSKIRGMFSLMIACAADFTDFLTQLPPEKREIDIKDAFTRYTNDVIATCGFGVKVDSMKEPKNEFFVRGTKATDFNSVALKLFILSLCPKLFKLLRLRLTDRSTADFFTNTFKEIIETRDKNGIVRPDMLQVIMDSRGKKDRKDLSIEDMVSQAFIFYFGGFETTAVQMCFAAHEIAVNSEVHARLQEEVDEVLEETSGKVSYEAINGMKYLEAVIYETLRKYPIAFILDRECEKPFVLPPPLPGGKPVLLEKKSVIWFPAYAIHHDPQYYEDPEKFCPERFLDDQKNILNSSYYMPFGIGPRMCIGNRFALLEVKVLLFYLLARCDLKPGAKTKHPLNLSGKRPMYPKDGFWLKVEPRDNPPACVQFLNTKEST